MCSFNSPIWLFGFCGVFCFFFFNHNGTVFPCNFLLSLSNNLTLYQNLEICSVVFHVQHYPDSVVDLTWPLIDTLLRCCQFLQTAPLCVHLYRSCWELVCAPYLKDISWFKGVHTSLSLPDTQLPSAGSVLCFPPSVIYICRFPLSLQPWAVWSSPGKWQKLIPLLGWDETCVHIFSWPHIVS